MIRAKSCCHLCGLVIEVGDDLELFPPAVFDPSSDLAHLNEAGVHALCLDRLPTATVARQTVHAYQRRSAD